jgi:oligoribonuclease nrnB
MVRLFSHSDLDGIGCGILAQLAFGKDNVEISYCDYDNIDSTVKEYLETEQDDTISIYITDIRVNEETAELLNKRGNVQLLDHHPTALGLNKYDWCNVVIEDSKGIKTSGTMLFYHWLGMTGCLSEELENNKVLERFAELVRDYDTWRWSELGEDGVICKQVNDLLYLYGRDDFIHWCISEIHDEVFPRLYAKDEVILKIKQDEIDRYIEEKNKTMFTSPMCGKVCGFVFADRFVSELGNRLCKMHPEIDFVAMIDIDGCTVSYRTVKEDIDLGKDVASLFGGGGHPKAAGSEFSQNIKSKVIEEIFG